MYGADMQQRSNRISLDEPMRFFMRSTSRDRLWSGLEAKLFETSGGFAQIGPASHHCISMHLSAPIYASCRFDGPAVRRLQVAGDIDLTTPGAYAAWRDEGETLMLSVSVEAPLFRSAAYSMDIDPDRVRILPQMQVRDPQLQYIAWALKAELEMEDRLGRVYAESLGLALASHLLRRYAHPRSAPNGIPMRLSNRRLRLVLEYVQEHLSEDLSLTELAEVANLSPSHFKVVFKQAVGMPVHQYIIRRRVEEAVRLIAGSDLPLTEIATLVGFSNQSHMARLTRKIAGASPAQLRNM